MVNLRMKWTEGENNTYTAKATRVCANDPSHVDEKTAEVTGETRRRKLVQKVGKITYTATAKFDDGTECTDTKVKRGCTSFRSQLRSNMEMG